MFKYLKAFRPVVLTGVSMCALVLLPYQLTAPQGLASLHADATTSATLLYTFNSAGVLQETGSMSGSSSHYFWVNSGAKLLMQDGLGKTVQGALPTDDSWRVLYGHTNPLDTGNGYYPQNVFRLVTRSVWSNVTQEMQFKIQHTNLTPTPNRDGYSGIFFFSRYHDGDNLYYAGMRMDGAAVIKKKVGGVYYTLDLEPVFPGTYDRVASPNLLTLKQWMRMRLVTEDQTDGVSLRLYLDATNTGVYTLVAHALDRDGLYGGTPVNSGPAYAGVRTDYMDAFFNDYRLSQI